MILVQGIHMSEAAGICVAETSRDVHLDIEALRDGYITKASLLVRCLDGADDRIRGWKDYLFAVALVARVLDP